MKTLLVSLIFAVFFNSCFGQDNSLDYQKIIVKTKFIDVYKISHKSISCEDKKNVTIDKGGNISECFIRIKKLNGMACQQVVDILLNKNSYGKTDSICFTTDYGLVLIDEKKKTIGTITTSLRCNNILFASDFYKEFTFTNSVKNKILKIIR